MKVNIILQCHTVFINAGENLPDMKLKTITTEDMKHALAGTKPSAAHLAPRYQKWQHEFGSS